MSEYKGDSKLFQAAEDPKALLAYRAVTGFAAIFTSAILIWGLGEYSEFRRDISSMKIIAARVDGKVDLLEDRVHALSTRLIQVDNRIDKIDDRVNTIQLKIH